MPGGLHEHEKGIVVYHRKDGALIYIHNGKKVRHARHIPALDRKHKQRGRKPKSEIPNPNYAHAGDGRIIHQNPHNRPIEGGGKRKAGKIHKKGGRRK